MVFHLGLKLILALGHLLLGFHGQSLQDPIQDGLYFHFSGYPCVLYLNQTHKVGCSSDPVRGVPILIQSFQELDATLSTIQGFDIIPVIPLELLTYQLAQKSKENNIIKGILVTSPTDITKLRSNIKKQPDFGPFVKRDWNPTGTGLLGDYLSIPIFAIFSTTPNVTYNATELVNAAVYNKKNYLSSNVLHGVELNTFMHGAINAKMCLQRQQCRPLIAQSIYTNLTTKLKPLSNVTVLTSTLDSRTLFEGLSLGLYDSLAGVLALLLSIDSMAKLDPLTLNRSYVFTFFDAETFDHTGSSAFINDLRFFKCNTQAQKCPYYSDTVCNDPCRKDTNFTELSWETIDTVYNVHYIDENPMVIYQKGDTRGIVPSPLLSFLKSNPEINYVQWTTLNETYPFTLGTMDLWEPTDIWKQRVCEVSQSILTTLSFSTSVNCSQLTPWVRLFQAFSSSKDVIGAKVSPRVSLVMKLLSSMTCHPQYCATSTPCVCIQPHLHEAVGPGLKFKAEQWAIQDPSLPHWVQSDWATIGIRSGFYMFKTSKQLEEFFIGLAISIITFLVVWKISVHVK